MTGSGPAGALPSRVNTFTERQSSSVVPTGAERAGAGLQAARTEGGRRVRVDVQLGKPVGEA